MILQNTVCICLTLVSIFFSEMSLPALPTSSQTLKKNGGSHFEVFYKLILFWLSVDEFNTYL